MHRLHRVTALVAAGGTQLAPRHCCRVQFRDGNIAEGTASVLPFVLSVYQLNGTWLGYLNWTTEFQLCGAPTGAGGSKWST